MSRVIAIALATAALGACQSIDEDVGTWEPAEAITGPLRPELGPPPTVVPAKPATLRVVTWNLHYAQDTDDIVAQFLASTEVARADVVMVQEIEAYPTEPASRANRIATALGMTWAYAPARAQRGGTHGIAIFSRFPLEDVQVRQLPFIDTAYKPRRRNAMEADLVVGDRRVRLVNVHLDVRIGPVDRILQLRPAVLEQPDPIVVGGDFNTNDWVWIENTVPLAGTQAVIGQSQAAVLDDYMVEQRFDGALPADTSTMRIPVFDMRLDNLYTRGTIMGARAVEHVAGSDHWPVWADVAM